MVKRRVKSRDNKRVSTSESTPAFNNPFGALADLRKDLPAVEVPTVPDGSASAAGMAVGLDGSFELIVGSEKAGRAGKTVTRIKNLPSDLVPELRRRMTSDLGCGATVDGGELLLLGDLVDRVVAWLKREGACHVAISGRTSSPRKRPAIQRSAVTPPQALADAVLGGKRREEIYPGLTVDVVLKADQSTGALSRGVVRDILTRSATHPHGIKVRLVDGRVGRVKQIIAVSGRQPNGGQAPVST